MGVPPERTGSVVEERRGALGAPPTVGLELDFFLESHGLAAVCVGVDDQLVFDIEVHGLDLLMDGRQEWEWARRKRV